MEGIIMEKSRVMIRLCVFTLLFAQVSFLQADGFRVGGYLPGPAARRVDFSKIEGIDELFLFSAETGPLGELDTSWLDRLPWPDLHAWAELNGARLILCVGGWERSEHFAAMASTRETRAAFIEAAIEYCSTHKIQGIDLDWEFPKTEREERDYALLLSELRDAFAPKGWSVFVTVSPEQNPTAKAIEVVDAVQIMSYDRGRRHATFEAMEAHVQKLLDAGVPPERLVVGLPFYGRRMEQLSDAKSYRAILAEYKPGPEADEAGGYFFNSQQTIRAKTRYAIDKGLRGVMFWQLEQDSVCKRSLLRAIGEEIAQE